MNDTKITHDQLHLEVLKAMGWRRTNAAAWVPPSGQLFQAVKSPPKFTLELLYQAEEMLSDDEAVQYGLELNTIMFKEGPHEQEIGQCDWHASKEQRARAFLKVKGIA